MKRFLVLGLTLAMVCGCMTGCGWFASSEKMDNVKENLKEIVDSTVTITENVGKAAEALAENAGEIKEIKSSLDELGIDVGDLDLGGIDISNMSDQALAETLEEKLNEKGIDIEDVEESLKEKGISRDDLKELGEELREKGVNLEDVQQSLDTLLEKGENLNELKDKAKDWGDDFKDKAKDFGENFGDKAKDFEENFGDKAKDFGENFGEKANNLGEKLEDYLSK